MKLPIFSRTRTLAALLLPVLAAAQGSNVLSVDPPQRVRAKRNETAIAKVKVHLNPGYHVNTDKPADPYLIPLKLTWSASPLTVEAVEYPKPGTHTLPGKAPMTVFSGDFEIVTTFKVPSNAAAGPALASGKLRYQACNDRMCLQPKTIDVPLTVEIW